jgi:hypothetical protein
LGQAGDGDARAHADRRRLSRHRSPKPVRRHNHAPPLIVGTWTSTAAVEAVPVICTRAGRRPALAGGVAVVYGW